mgnify:CR=1 FL=1
MVPGPRVITTTRAIVATGSYAPRRTAYAFDPPQGAEEADGAEGLARAEAFIQQWQSDPLVTPAVAPRSPSTA